MKDKDFLVWLYGRLEHQHRENPDVDYMHKFRCIIENYPADKITPNVLELTEQDIAEMKLDKPRKPKDNVINYEDAVKAFDDKIEWSDESIEDCDTEGNE